jgi:hypothetical protein
MSDNSIENTCEYCDSTKGCHVCPVCGATYCEKCAEEHRQDCTEEVERH